jgi:hypothetical protein
MNSTLMDRLHTTEESLYMQACAAFDNDEYSSVQTALHGLILERIVENGWSLDQTMIKRIKSDVKRVIRSHTIGA